MAAQAGERLATGASTPPQGSPGRRRILLVAVDSWHGSARLPTAFQSAGFEVALLCRPGVVASLSRGVEHRFALHADKGSRSNSSVVCRTVADFSPDMVVPLDDASVRMLHAVRRALAAETSSDVRRVLDRSLPRVDVSSKRTGFLEIAERAGIACPAHAEARSLREALRFAHRRGWPVYLKRDNTAGGSGVRLCASPAELTAAFAALTNTAGPIWSAAGVLRRGRRTMHAMGLGAGPGISIQSVIPGEPAFHSAVALDGRWLAGLSAEVEEFHPRPTGPSTRVLLHGDRAMDDIARRLIGALGYSGFCGFDFIRDRAGNLTLLELNARPTPVSHLGGLVGLDLCVALNAALSGQPVPSATPKPPRRVALFPQDWVRDPIGTSREQCDRDVPLNDPDLLKAMAADLPHGWDDGRAGACQSG